jgi:ribosomal protein S21
MLVCHGVVKNNVIAIPANITLVDGMKVEVQIPLLFENTPITSTEKQFKQKLLKLGLLTDIKMSHHYANEERSLAQVQGKPLSQLIIEERR